MAVGTVWQKSSFSSDEDAPNCIEVAATPEALRLRENDEPGTMLTTTATGLAALLHHIRDSYRY
ncbi:DUF397 domain-containing protein [Streptomyces poonensis]|uniref:DUF397 domain-containing protein n=1 Tax=Streptomyces poonensis TaxID=68255 RepID=A0A918PKR9_9ACTN|nr:DUF397 domain-containing protein [Streptomyces poonensis]GGZ12993.1 hypothetical protein GCM10010365_35960 [Streptomyces poonensis]GLJ91949.1 hypothetical protein GCM10017589_45570 [Streptomyces poonensis]